MSKKVKSAKPRSGKDSARLSRKYTDLNDKDWVDHCQQETLAWRAHLISTPAIAKRLLDADPSELEKYALLTTVLPALAPFSTVNQRPTHSVGVQHTVFSRKQTR
eukprot:m.139125 g.139125  ORF g.139125 m.139125 type:complete len:105 (-) comp15935_c0_seq3:589-903(-)